MVGNGGPLRAEQPLELFRQCRNRDASAGGRTVPRRAVGGADRRTAHERASDRPSGRCVTAGGARIDYLEQTDYPPLRLNGGFTGGEVSVDGSVSSQFLTALLMTAPLAQNDTTITIKGELVSKPYIDITLHLMRCFGVDVDNHHYQRFVVKGQQQYQSP